MPRFDVRVERPVDYHLVVDPHREGATIGIYQDQPISESVTDYFGRSFSYGGVAPRRRDGQFDVAALKPGQFIVEPGLLYCMNIGKPNSQKNGLMSGIGGWAGSRIAQAVQNSEKGSQSSAQAPEKSANRVQALQIPGAPKDGRKVITEIAGSFVAYLGLAFVIHLLLAALHAG